MSMLQEGPPISRIIYSLPLSANLFFDKESTTRGTRNHRRRSLYHQKNRQKNTQVPQIPHSFTSEMYDNIQDRPGAKTSFGSTPTTSNTLEAFLSF
jgi:hypothetical protein